MSGSRNRTAGHNWERVCCKKLIEIYPDVCTSRAESRTRDDLKVDLCKTGFLNVQNKTRSQKEDYVKVLGEMPDEEGQINVIFDKQTRKKGNRFLSVGEFAHLNLDDFIELVRKAVLYDAL